MSLLQRHQFVVPGTTEPNFAVIKRDMAKLKKGISQIVDDIIKENEPPEEEPSPPKRGRQSSREPRSPPTPPTKSTPMRTKATLRAQTVAPSSSGPLPASSSSGPLPPKTQLTGSVPPPKSQSAEPPLKPTGLLGLISKLRGDSERENIRRATQWVEETQQQTLGNKREYICHAASLHVKENEVKLRFLNLIKEN